ncbi:MAG: hypothetical protein EVA65_15870 [Oceanococcus sp.]|nr:MAG: hypothetical protein EVA65_15870 [Oceanococcus sp.]
MTETPKQERTQAAGAASDCNELLGGKFQPAQNYADLLTQARALATLAHAQEHRLKTANETARKLQVCQSWREYQDKQLDSAMFLLADIAKTTPDVCDCVDNRGETYQSQGAADLLERATDWVADMPPNAEAHAPREGAGK